VCLVDSARRAAIARKDDNALFANADIEVPFVHGSALDQPVDESVTGPIPIPDPMKRRDERGGERLGGAACERNFKCLNEEFSLRIGSGAEKVNSIPSDLCVLF